MYDDKTPEGIKAEILEELEDIADIREGSYTNNLVSAAAYMCWRMYTSLAAVVPIAFVDETSGAYIDKRCAEYGLSRKTGVKAVCRLLVTGTDGAEIPAGTAFLTAGGLLYYTLEHAVISGGSVIVAAEAEDVGDAYNVGAGEVTRRYTNIAGVTEVTNPEAAAGGIDVESDASLVTRLREHMQQPATSGNIYHYIQWAKQADGVGYVYVMPLWDGPGTVKVCVAGDQLTAVDDAVITECAQAIEAQRPVGAAVTVVSARPRKVAFFAEIALDGTAAPDEIKTAFQGEVAEYFKTIAFSGKPVSYNKLIYCLMSTAGVFDHSTVTVNGGDSNLVLEEDEVPYLDEVELSVYEL